MKCEESKSVAIYVRVSTEEQAVEGLSLQAQLDTLIQYCQLYNYKIYRQYIDSGISGKETSNRPGLLQLVADAKKHRFDLVLVWKLSRLSRNLKDLLILMDIFENNHIAFASYSEKFDTTNPVGRMTLQLLGSIAEFERNTIIENVRLGLEAHAKRGGRTGTVFGYDASNKTMTINEKEADIIRTIYDLYVNQGKEPRAIADFLNEKGCYSKRAKPFRTEGIINIIDNPVYIGYNRHLIGTDKAYLTKGTHEAVIDEAIWYKAFDLRRKQKSDRSLTVQSEKSLLSGLLSCHRCKRKRNVFYSQSKGRKYRYYKCTHGGCLLNANVAEKAVNGLFLKLLHYSMVELDVMHCVRKTRPDLIRKDYDFDASLTQMYDKLHIQHKSTLLSAVFETIEIDDSGLITDLTSRFPLLLPT